MIVVIDNYDSFTYNLVHYVGCLGAEVVVRRNDRTTVAELASFFPDRIIISPGPGYPDEAGLSMEIIDYFKDKCPVLGVCLGHQSIGQVFGGRVAQAGELVHGKESFVTHDGKTIFRDIPNPFKAGRYHSLVVERDNLPDCLMITAQVDSGLIMGLRHKVYPVEGVQFHPESILTEAGQQIIDNFLKYGEEDDS
ncbi:aminodeoxychorismate/anthranilate synthase component II [candidate division KSB1 bacterium]|nr:aminodeoxychorismate/anthranilate synthase component II [candidate division KSB1 bacterium]RQW00900.1 MAG: aminodeoxychorismate/anthranilate synthase component II [candidate division KSB1 bacterium]